MAYSKRIECEICGTYNDRGELRVVNNEPHPRCKNCKVWIRLNTRNPYEGSDFGTLFLVLGYIGTMFLSFFISIEIFDLGKFPSVMVMMVGVLIYYKIIGAN